MPSDAPDLVELFNAIAASLRAGRRQEKLRYRKRPGAKCRALIYRHCKCNTQCYFSYDCADTMQKCRNSHGARHEVRKRALFFFMTSTWPRSHRRVHRQSCRVEHPKKAKLVHDNDTGIIGYYEWSRAGANPVCEPAGGTERFR